MRSAIFAIASLIILPSVLFTVTARGQGVIVPIVCDLRPCRPRPVPPPLPNVLPVKSIKLDTKIVQQVATTRVEQVFRNDTPYTLEGTYFFPIPETAAIVEFSIWENGKKLTGEIRSREEARRIYDAIVRRQKDPGLLEYAGKDLFQASIFPIPPNSDKKLELVFSQTLKAESGTVAYRYPLGAGRNLWSGPASGVEGRRSAQQGKIGTVSGKITIEAKGSIRNIYSPSHKIDIGRQGERMAELSFESTENDNDLQLFYTLSEADVGMSLMSYREAGKDGYFLLMMSPKDDLAEREIVGKDIVFVLDTSGSMADEGKMEKARAALLFGIRSLRVQDRFNVIGFAGEEHLMERRLIAADAAGKRRGETFVNALKPSGGTNINDSLIASLQQFESDSRPKMLVFMTDGLPTVGESDVDKIIANLNKSRKLDVRIFPFGFGYDVNTALLDRIGSENSGISDYVQPKEDLEVKVSNFFTRVSSPVLSDISLDLGNIKTDLVYPRKYTDLFKGSQMVLIGRYTNDSDLQNASIVLTGSSGRTAKRYKFDELDFPLKDEANDFLPRLWASRRVGWLVEQIRINGETKELKDEVADLGTRYGIVTPYTSYLADDGSFVTAPKDSERFRALAKAAPSALREQSGAGAVRQSVQQNSAKSNASIVADGVDKDEQVIIGNTAANRFVANKNFFNRSGVWTDSEYSDGLSLPFVSVKFASTEYFDLVEKQPELARYFALGRAVTVVWNNRVYKVTE
ncbi:MAG: VIT and VWA domain-containing protein [Acidobacteriota bacterium]